MPMGLRHDVIRAADERLGHVLVEQVAHGVDENAARVAPPEWQRELVRMERQREPVAIAWITHRLEPECESLSIAVLAPWTYLGAAGDRVPGRVSPLDRGVIAHGSHHSSLPGGAGAKFDGSGSEPGFAAEPVRSRHTFPAPHARPRW